MSGEMSEKEIIYDWNSVEKVAALTPGRKLEFFDETLRDGIQSPSVVDPKIDDKIKLVGLANDLGIDAMDLGLPGAGARAIEDVTRLVEVIRDGKLKVKPGAAARTHIRDVQAIVDISQKTGMEIEVLTFIGSSPIRLYAEGWDLDGMLKKSAEALDLAVKYNLPATYVTEDTTRSRPEVLGKLFSNAVAHGATRICVCDTVGHATPNGIRNIIKFTRNLLEANGATHVKVDWHGHNDRGMAVPNAIFAAEYGADRVHGTAMGIGERVGNASLDQILMNLKLLGELEGRDLSKLLLWCRTAARATHVPIPVNYPLVGGDAFRTATGVHAAAIIKAEAKGHSWLADRIYSGVPAAIFGKEQEIEIGHYSGESNVVYWLKKRSIEPEPGLVSNILAVAKSGDHILTEDEVRQIIKDYRATAVARSQDSQVSQHGL